MINNMNSNRTKLLIIQRIIAYYRFPVFQRLAQQFDVTVIFGRGTDSGGNKNATAIVGFKYRQLKSINRDIFIGNKSYFVSFFPGLRKAINEISPDVIISEGDTNYFNNVYLSSFVKKTNISIIYWTAGYDSNSSLTMQRRIFNLINRHFLSRPKAFLAYGTVAKDSLISQGVSAEKIFIAKNTIQSDNLFVPGQPEHNDLKNLRNELGIGDCKVMLYAGAIEKRKNIEFLVELFERLNRDDAIMIILGDGPDETRIKNLINSKGLEQKIFMPGRIIKDRTKYFLLANLYIIPSQWGFVNLPLSYGLPVVVNRKITEGELIVDGKNGFICDENDYDSFAVSINKLLDNLEFANQMGLNGYTTFKVEANIDKMIEGIEDSIKYVLN